MLKFIEESEKLYDDPQFKEEIVKAIKVGTSACVPLSSGSIEGPMENISDNGCADNGCAWLFHVSYEGGYRNELHSHQQLVQSKMGAATSDSPLL